VGFGAKRKDFGLLRLFILRLSSIDNQSVFRYDYDHSQYHPGYLIYTLSIIPASAPAAAAAAVGADLNL
jgi:hypothetical protein